MRYVKDGPKSNFISQVIRDFYFGRRNIGIETLNEYIQVSELNKQHITLFYKQI